MEYANEFERWWESFWVPLHSYSEIMNETFKLVAHKAWLAAINATTTED